MAKRAKITGKGKTKGKKTGPSSSNRVIKTRSIDAVLGIQELEIEEATDSMEQCHEEYEHYAEKILSPGESELTIRRQSEIRNDFSDWLSIANRTAQDINTGKKVSPPILRSNIVRNLENSFELSDKEAEVTGSKKKIKIEFEDIAEEVNYLQPSLVCYVIGANPPINILEGFMRRLWKEEVVKVGLLAKGIFIIRFQNMEQRDKVMQQGYVFFERKPMVMKPWNPIDDFTKEEVSNVDNVTKNRDRLQYPRILIQQVGKFFVSLVYAFNDEKKREDLWAELEEVALKIDEPWIIMGDFNEILNANERVGKRAQSLPSQRFRDTTEKCKLANLKFSCSFFTWNNKQKPEERIFSKIDRAMVNTQWLSNFPCSEAVFLPEMAFDHSPILTEITTKTMLAEIQGKLSHDPGNEELMKQEHMVRKKYAEISKAFASFMTQKTKISWAKFGDDNSHLFHASLKLRRLQNKIFSIEDEYGNWCDSPDKVQFAFLEYYQRLLGSNAPERRKDKAPGPDGYGSAFFQDNWDLVRPDLVEAVISFLNSGKILKEINTTTITLIPKTSCPKSVVDFRPISCCNVVYKVVTKVICNRLRKVLPDLIAKNQGGFVHGRFISHNVLVCQDLVRFYGRKNCRPSCMIKIDLRKAYDTIEWEFLEEMMTALGFPGKFIKLIMECICTPKFSLLLNGSMCGFFNAKRGLRQGDPMSPLLFVLGMEYLSKIFIKVGDWPGFKFHDRCATLRLNHMCFADDLLVFCHGDFISALLLLKGLKLFSASSGLQPNEQKIAIYCAGMQESEVNRIIEASEFTRSTLPFRYLGILICSKKISRAECQSLLEKMTSRIRMWSTRNLSYMGRVTLINSVLLAIHTYWA
uniref:Reverse transcriptase domain-containing protein n=1 Tax=Cannabis sativa TaxID=3483 RepID=A0A803P9J0_CANSA